MKINKSGLVEGDKNIYRSTEQPNLYRFPINEMHNWTNIIKATKSTYNFMSVPKDIKVFKYPESSNWFESNRLLGLANKHISIAEFDKLNARIGGVKKVNLIMIGFDDPDPYIGKFQESKWIGGKKNDLVLCYGYYNNKVKWAYVFGWTEKELVKRNLETLLLTNKINNDLLPKIEQEVIKNYELKDFKKFNYMQIEPPGWAYIALLAVQLLVQGGFWVYAYYNNNKENT